MFPHGDKPFSGHSATTSQGKAIGIFEVLFVDEVTMISKDIFDLIDKLKEIRSQLMNNQHLLSMPFGGIILMFTGDLCQVACFIRNSDDVSELKPLFSGMIVLKKLMRQIELSGRSKKL